MCYGNTLHLQYAASPLLRTVLLRAVLWLRLPTLRPPYQRRARRPSVEQHCLDHEDGIESFSCERTFMIRRRKQVLGGAPAMVMAQINKGKDVFSLQVCELSPTCRRLVLLPMCRCPAMTLSWQPRASRLPF